MALQNLVIIDVVIFVIDIARRAVVTIVAVTHEAHQSMVGLLDLIQRVPLCKPAGDATDDARSRPPDNDAPCPR